MGEIWTPESKKLGEIWTPDLKRGRYEPRTGGVMSRGRYENAPKTGLLKQCVLLHPKRHNRKIMDNGFSDRQKRGEVW